MASEKTSSNRSGVCRREKIRVSFLRCLSTPTHLTLSRNSSIYATQGRQNSLVLVDPVEVRSPRFSGLHHDTSCVWCEHRERTAFLNEDEAGRSSVEVPEKADKDEVDIAEVTMPFQEHPALSPTTSSEPDYDSECIVCFNPRDTIQLSHKSCVLMPCQHHQICVECANRIQLCPLCREEITKIVPLHSKGSIVSRQPLKSWKLRLSRLSHTSEDEGPRHRRCLNVVIVILSLILAPAVFAAFHFLVWDSWGMVKILSGVLLSGLIVCLMAVVIQRCCWRSRRPASDVSMTV